MPDLKFFLLGSPYLERNGLPVEMDTRKALALLSYLTINNGGHNRDALAALLWPDYDESGARGAFRRTLSTLNKALGEGILDISRERISLTSHTEPSQNGLWVDVWEFHRLLEAPKSHSHTHQTACHACLSALQEAANLYRDDFLAGFSLRDSVSFDDWQFFQAEGLRQELASALEKLAHMQAESGDFTSALATARRWTSLDPLNEPAHRLLMRLYEWSGQHGAALRQYRECVRILDQQLSVPPLDETTQLYQTIQERRLETIPIRVTTETKTPPADEQPQNSTPASLPGYLAPLVGRQTELEALVQAHQKAHQSGFLVALQGEAGIGKTRLAQEFIEQARSQGAICLTSRCFEGETGLAFGPVIEALRTALSQPQAETRLKQIAPEWLAEAARLLPDSHLPIPPSGSSYDTPGAQSHFMEGVTQTLIRLCASDAGGKAGVLFFDDLHWADSASLDLLTYLSHRLTGVFMLVSWRSEQMPPEHPLRNMLAAARRNGNGFEINLSRLPFKAVQQLLQSSLLPGITPPDQAKPAAQKQPDFSLAEKLFAETEGLPFFIIEYMEMLYNRPQTAPEDWQIPQTVRDLLHSRLHSVDETGAQLLAAAAVLGRSFEYEILRLASGRSELETVAGLENLLKLGLIHEQPAAASTVELVYDFSHEKLRRLVYEETSQVRRRLLHLRAADALVTRLRQQRESTALVAQHYQLAGQSALAADYYQRAGAAARAVYANREAIGHFKNALACGYTQPAELHEAIGDLQSLAGEYHAALTSYETAAALCSPERLGWLEHRLGNVRHQRGEWEMAEYHFESAIEALEAVREIVPHSTGEQARVYADWSRTAYRRSSLPQAQTLALQALSMAEESLNQPALAQAQNMLGLLARKRQDFPQAIVHLQNSLEITTLLKDPAGRAAALNNLARVYADCRDLPKSIELTQAALALCHQQGDRHRAAALHNNLADLYHAAGNATLAMDHLKQAVIVFAEIGQQAGEPLPEIWMLTEW